MVVLPFVRHATAGVLSDRLHVVRCETGTVDVRMLSWAMVPHNSKSLLEMSPRGFEDERMGGSDGIL